MKLTFNDKTREVPNGLSLMDLLSEIGLESKRGLAVAVNQAVVPSSDWAVTSLSEGDDVFVIQATQGG